MLPFLLSDDLGRDDGLVIVVSPLLSLVVDQVKSLRRRSVGSAIMSSESTVGKETKEDLQTSSLFCAPKAIDYGKWRDVIAEPDLSSRVLAIV